VRSGARMCEISYDFVVSRGRGNLVRFYRRPYDSTVSRGRGHLPWTPPSSIPVDAAIFVACGCRQRRLGTRWLVSSNPALKVRLIHTLQCRRCRPSESLAMESFNAYFGSCNFRGKSLLAWLQLDQFCLQAIFLCGRVLTTD
jgi:hypothetical protein